MPEPADRAVRGKPNRRLMLVAATMTGDMHCGNERRGDREFADCRWGNFRREKSSPRTRRHAATGEYQCANGRRSCRRSAPAAPGEHPIDASLAIAHKVQEHLEKDVKDYTCIFVKNERVNGELVGPQQMLAKVRQEPLSVYFKFLKPADVKGREVIYYPEKNGGKLVAREGSGLKRLLSAPFGSSRQAPWRWPGRNIPLATWG